MSFQPRTGARCTCKPGIQRDNCGTCEATGWVIDFRAIREAPLDAPVITSSDTLSGAIPWKGEEPRPVLTVAQSQAFYQLADRSGLVPAELIAKCTWDLLFWKPCQNATLFVPFHGMLVGIEPDGYTHS